MDADGGTKNFDANSTNLRELKDFPEFASIGAIRVKAVSVSVFIRG